MGWSTLVAAELIAATRGLGFMVQSAGEFLATDVVLAGIAVIARDRLWIRTGTARATASPDALAWRNTMSERLTIIPLGPYIGAQVSGLDVTRPLSDNQFEQLYHAVLRHQVVFLREQAITPHQQRALALRFGDLHIHPVYPHAEGWRRLSSSTPTTITRRITITGIPM
ncbi:Alpha-ketoglutarate-dependent taurine dioxygenase [Enterobacter hormaechei]|nr:Alpha-ketoglutarate-dependent taurine dioxygenase [Enterobacter hormaechei]